MTRSGRSPVRVFRLLAVMRAVFLSSSGDVSQSKQNDLSSRQTQNQSRGALINTAPGSDEPGSKMHAARPREAGTSPGHASPPGVPASPRAQAMPGQSTTLFGS